MEGYSRRRVETQITILILVVFFISGCWNPDSPTANTIAGPSDNAINAAQEHANSLPDNDPAKAAALAAVAQMRAEREEADRRAANVANVAGTFIPYAGTALAVAWTIMQKLRNIKTEKERDESTLETMTVVAGIDEMISTSSPEQADKIKAVQKKHQDRAGVRAGIRKKIVKLKDPDQRVL